MRYRLLPLGPWKDVANDSPVCEPVSPVFCRDWMIIVVGVTGALPHAGTVGAVNNPGWIYFEAASLMVMEYVARMRRHNAKYGMRIRLRETMNPSIFTLKEF